jgi:hypothetical protein
MHAMTVDQSLLDKIVRRIVEVAQPEQIILFGSAARGEMGPDSDVDLHVVKANGPHRGEATGAPSSARLFRRNGASALTFSGAALVEAPLWREAGRNETTALLGFARMLVKRLNKDTEAHHEDL